MALNVGMEWLNYIVAVQYVAMALVFVWWFYTRRVKRGFKVIFCATAGAGERGSYTVDEKALAKFKTKMVTEKGKLGVKNLDCFEIVKGVPDSVPQYLGMKEVKAGDEFVVRNGKAYFIPWDDIAYKEFGWEYMVMDITLMRSYQYGGFRFHDYDARTVQVSGHILEPMAKEMSVKQFLPMLVLAVAFATVIGVMVTYFVTNYLVQQSYVGWIPKEDAGKFVGSVVLRLFGGF